MAGDSQVKVQNMRVYRQGFTRRDFGRETEAVKGGMPLPLHFLNKRNQGPLRGIFFVGFCQFPASFL